MTNVAVIARTNVVSAVQTIIVLFKLRVVALLVFASLAGALLASQGKPSMEMLILLLLTGTMSSAGASALNQYIERVQDTQMARTRQRPLASGALAQPGWVLGISIGLVALAVLMAIPFSLSLAFFLALGAAVYVGVYTLWLKPRTLLNIVIGGIAGSCAVLSGSAAVGNWAQPSALSLALLIFVWTPIHFWSLAQAYREDYARAGVPMLPVIVSGRASAGWIALHTAVTAFIACVLAVDPRLGWAYLLPTGMATVWMVWQSVRLIINPVGKQALQVFRVSNIYLGLILLAIYVRVLF